MSKIPSKKSTGKRAAGPYPCRTTHISSVHKTAAKTLIEYDNDQTLDIKEKIFRDSQIQSESNESTGKEYGGTYSCKATHIYFGNKPGAKTSIKYEIDDTLDIKDETTQDPETITDQKRNKANESKFCTVYIREDNILDVKPKSQTLKKQEIPESKQEMKYTCKKCARTYKKKSYMNYHQKFNCGVMPQFSCKFCDKIFKRKYVLNAHVDRVHHNTSSKTSLLKHKCDKCSRSYNWLYDLTRHKRVDHAAVEPQFCCDHCEYKTNMKRNLSKHITSRHSQTSKSRNKCDKCSRTYATLSGLNQHKRLEHATIKPQFACNFCGYKTKMKCILVAHMNSRHSQTSKSSYNCDECSRSYTWLSALRRHKSLEHAAVKTRFICDYCGHQTNQKSSLSRHITSRHLK